MRGAALVNAVGLLKEELRRAGSLVMRVADRTRVPAGGALAVDRERFSAEMTARDRGAPADSRRAPRGDGDPRRAAGHPRRPARSPATRSPPISRARSEPSSSRTTTRSRPSSRPTRSTGTRCGSSRATTKGETTATRPLRELPVRRGRVPRVRRAPWSRRRRSRPRAFEEVRYFEGCLPIEVMAERGEMTLAFGPMKPVGLADPRTGRRPYAVVQLRPEDAAATAYNLVGFQTRMTYGEQARVFRTIPGLEEAEFLRFGSVHRNTFVNAPELLDEAMQLRARARRVPRGADLRRRGLRRERGGRASLCALPGAAHARAAALVFRPRPRRSAASSRTSRARVDRYQPSNITWAHLPPLAQSATEEARSLRGDGRARAAGSRCLACGDGSGVELFAGTLAANMLTACLTVPKSGALSPVSRAHVVPSLS